MKTNQRRSLCLLTTAVISLGFVGSALSQEQVYQFDIPAESLGQALTDFSQVSSKSIITSEDVVRGRTTNGLHGRFTATQALDALLAGTDLHAEINSSGVMMVRPKNVQAASNEAAETPRKIETVTVTGTHLRDVEALTPITTITSVDLIKQGYTTLTEALQQLPQNTKAGVSSESNPITGLGEGAVNNYGFANGVNLRGLGPNDTLVLLNGRRLPPTALGSTIDISGIPVSAIDRVEILDDGASAIYGADAVAGVVNIITKTDYSGVETGLRLDQIANGKQPNYGGYALAGFDWDGGNMLFDYDYEKQNPLPASSRSYTNTIVDPRATYLLPRQETSSFYGALSQQINSKLQFSVDGLFSSRSFFATSNVGSGSNTNSGRDNQSAGSVEFDYLPSNDWKVSLVGQFGTEFDHTSVLQPLFGEVDNVKYGYRTETVEAQLAGSALELPGGEVKVALGSSYRHEGFDQNEIVCTPSCGSPIQTQTLNNVFAVYGELLLPIVGPDNAIPLVKQLRVDSAVRYDHYDNFGGTTNPKITVQWIPVDDLSLHGSYATSFKAPTLYNLGPAQSFGYIYYVNPADPTAGESLDYYSVTNPNLRPETATTLNGGVSYKPHQIPGLSLDASYFDIRYHNKIETLVFNFGFPNLLTGALGPYAVFNPTAAQVNAVIAQQTQLNCFAASCDPASIQALANLGTVNAASVNLDGLDFNARYEADVGLGHIDVNAGGSYFLSYVQRITSGADAVPGSGLIYNPARFRGKINLGWNLGPWSANARLNYTGSERNNVDCASSICPISSWTTVDLSGSYSLEGISDAPFLKGSRINLSVFNLFDAAPPFAQNALGVNYDPVNANPLGRTFAVSLTKRW